MCNDCRRAAEEACRLHNERTRAAKIGEEEYTIETTPTPLPRTEPVPERETAPAAPVEEPVPA